MRLQLWSLNVHERNRLPESLLKAYETASRLHSCRYCSKEAQKADWAAGHKIECKTWQKMRSNRGTPPDHVPPASLRILLRILWKREQELQRKNRGEVIPFWQSFDSVASLIDHTDDPQDMRFEERIDNIRLASAALCALLLLNRYSCCIFWHAYPSGALTDPVYRCNSVAACTEPSRQEAKRLDFSNGLALPDLSSSKAVREQAICVQISGAELNNTAQPPRATGCGQAGGEARRQRVWCGECGSFGRLWLWLVHVCGHGQPLRHVLAPPHACIC
jgi:hypothetical protein